MPQELIVSKTDRAVLVYAWTVTPSGYTLVQTHKFKVEEQVSSISRYFAPSHIQIGGMACFRGAPGHQPLLLVSHSEVWRRA
jgi:hypothetical protein